MEKYNGSELLWIVNEKTKECDILKIDKDFAYSLISKKAINYSSLSKDYYIYTTSGIVKILGLEEKDYYNKMKIEQLYSIFSKTLNSFKNNEIKFLFNEKNNVLRAITISKKANNIFCYDITSGEKIKGNVIFSDNKKEWNFIPTTDCKSYSFDNAKKIILANKKIYTIGILSTLNKKFLNFEEVKKIKDVFEKTLINEKKAKINKNERSF